MASKSLVRHDQTCHSCSESYIVLQQPDSETELGFCPFCGSSEVGVYGSETPTVEDAGED